MKWGPIEKEAWFKEQTIKRSYRAQVVQKIQSMTANFDVKQYGNYPKLIHALGGKIWCVNFEDLTQDQVDSAHRLGLRVNAWTVDAPQEMIKMINMGVDAIITNRPDVLRGLLAARGLLSPSV